MSVSSDIIVALLGGEGIASVIAAVSAFRANRNSKQLKPDSGSSVADAVARIEAKVTAHDVEFRDMKAHIDLIDSHLRGVADDVREERKARRRDFATLEDEIEHSCGKPDSERK